MDNIGERIKQKRKELGLTQAELGEKLDVTDRAVSKWEQGEGDPNLSLIPNLAKVLGVSLDYLLLGREEPTFSLDDMDVEKRLSYLIKNDDLDNFVRYGYVDSRYVFGSINYKYVGNLNDLNEKTWKEMIEHKAIKIFNLCCDKLIEKNTQNVWCAFLVYNFLDDFIKMVVDAKRPDVLETIGFRCFAVNDIEANKVVKNKPFLSNYSLSHYVDKPDTYFIKKWALEYIFHNRIASPECFDYATTFEFKIKPIRGGILEYTITHLHEDIIDLAIKYKTYNVIENALELFKGEIRSDLKKPSSYTYNYQNGFYLKNTYLIQNDKIVARFIPFKLSIIEQLIEDNQIELAKQINEYNKMIIKKAIDIDVRNKIEIDKIQYFSESEFLRFQKLNCEKLSNKEKEVLLCVKDKIIVIDKIRKLRDLNLIKEIIDNNYYHYYEFVFDMISKKNFKSLLEFFIDNNLKGLATTLIESDGDYSRLLSDSWTFFNLEKGYATEDGDYRKNKKILENQNKLDIKEYGTIYYGELRININEEKK